MKLKEIIDESTDENEDIIMLLESVNVEKAECDQLRTIVKHLQKQFRNRYKYLVGSWRNAHRAKSTRTGKFVKAQEVVNYLEK